MKKTICIAISTMLLAGSVPVCAAEQELFTKIPHTFTAKVGTTEFTKDGEAQPLDVAVYLKDSYTMLPLRTFLHAALEIHPSNMIWNGEEQAAYAIAPTTQYDEIEPLGDGYFLAQKYTGETDIGLGISMGGRKNVRYLLDSKGKVLQTYDTGTDNYMRDGGEQTFLVGRNTENGFGNGAIDWEGKTVIPFLYNSVEPFSEGLAVVRDKNGEGYVNRKGEVVIALQFEEAAPFSEGLAVVKKKDGTYAYIDETGKTVIDASKYSSISLFYEGLAKVRDRNTRQAGFIDKTGREVIPCRYQWAGYFRNGVTYASDAEEKTWLIDKTGKKLKLIAEGKYLSYADDDMDKPNQPKNGMVRMEDIVDLPDGDHTHLMRYFDENGALSYEMYRLKKGLSEGLAPYWDETTKKYGYVNESGTWVIAPAFDAAERFQDGYAVVAKEITLADGTRDVEWGVIRHPNP